MPFIPQHTLLEPELSPNWSEGLGGGVLEHEAPEWGLGAWEGADGYQRENHKSLVEK